MTNGEEYNKTISDFADRVIKNHEEVYKKYPYYCSTEFVKSAIISVQMVIDNNPKTVSAIGYGSAQFNNPKISFMNDVKIHLESRLPKS